MNPSSLPPALETAGARLTAVRDTTATDVCLRLVGGYCDGSAWGFGDSATIDACFSGYAATTCECSKTNSTYCFPSSLSIDNKSDNGCPLLPMPNAEMYVSKMPDMTTALAFSSAYREEQRDTNNPATQLFARWAGSSGLEWNSISKTSTTAARVFKDEEAEFGRVLCDRGIIVQLTKQYPNSYEALVMFDYGNIIHLTALGDTGALVEKTSAAFCGVVTGVYTYSNTGGGTTHAVDAVGMFDLPSNRKKLSPPAATNPPAPSHPDRDALAGYCFRGNDEHGVRKFCSFTEADCKSLRDSQGVSAECFPIDRMPCTPSGSDIWCDVGL